MTEPGKDGKFFNGLSIGTPSGAEMTFVIRQYCQTMDLGGCRDRYILKSRPVRSRPIQE